MAIEKKLYRAKPYFPEDDKVEILEAWKGILDSGMFIQGKYVEEFEKLFAEYCGTKYAIATNSGATSLEVMIRASGLEGGKIIVPTQTFVASISAIVRSNNTPVIADIDPVTQILTLDIIKEYVDKDTIGVMLVHMAGMLPPDYSEIKEYCDANNLLLFEDASHAVGARIDSTMAGNLGKAAAFSLFATKIITSGEGGIITTNDDKFAEQCRILRNHGSVRNPSEVPGLDYGVNCTIASSNYRMTETAAVVGITQIKRVDEFVDKRNEIADTYKRILNSSILEVPDIPDNIRMSWWQYLVALPKGTAESMRTEFLKRLLDEYDIPTANAYWPACHDQPAFSSYLQLRHILSKNMYPVADDLLYRHFSLPMYVEMDIEQAEYVANSVNTLLDDLKYTSA
jgi:perosamine synthetase